MATSTEQTPVPAVKRAAAKKTVKPAPAPEKPFLRFYHSESLRDKTLAVLKTIEQAQDSTRHRNALSGIVIELTDSGMDYYFLKAVRAAQMGFVVEQSARLGIGGVMRVMNPVIYNIIGHMNQAQLRTVCSHIREIME